MYDKAIMNTKTSHRMTPIVVQDIFLLDMVKNIAFNIMEIFNIVKSVKADMSVAEFFVGEVACISEDKCFH